MVGRRLWIGAHKGPREQGHSVMRRETGRPGPFVASFRPILNASACLTASPQKTQKRDTFRATGKEKKGGGYETGPNGERPPRRSKE
jgi:hypothetical protein